jgi:hypothetical protein
LEISNNLPKMIAYKCIIETIEPNEKSYFKFGPGSTILSISKPK